MQKKIIMLTVSLLAIGGGALYWQKRPSDKFDSTLQPSPTVIQNENIPAEEGLKIISLDLSHNIIIGKLTAGINIGKQIKVVIESIDVVNDKNGEIKPLAYLRPGMGIDVRGYIKNGDSGTIYTDMIIEYGPQPSY